MVRLARTSSLVLGAAIVVAFPASSSAQLRARMPAPSAPAPALFNNFNAAQPVVGTTTTQINGAAATGTNGAALANIGNLGVGAATTTTNPFFNNNYNAQFSPLLNANPYAATGTNPAQLSPYANPYANPYAANPYANPYAANPYANPYAANPYANPYGGAPVSGFNGTASYSGFMSPLGAQMNSAFQNQTNPMANGMMNPALAGASPLNSSGMLNALGLASLLQFYPMLTNGGQQNNNNNNNRALP